MKFLPTLSETMPEEARFGWAGFIHLLKIYGVKPELHNNNMTDKQELF